MGIGIAVDFLRTREEIEELRLASPGNAARWSHETPSAVDGTGTAVRGMGSPPLLAPRDRNLTSVGTRRVSARHHAGCRTFRC